jgi:TniQ
LPHWGGSCHPTVPDTWKSSSAEPQRLWLYRTKPREDELYSSWLVRLAHGLAIKLQSFVVHVLGMSPGFWTDDVDRDPGRRALRILAAGTAVPFNRLAAMGLSAYDGYLWECYYPRGPLPWVMPIGRDGRRRRDHGQQFCRRCLAEDEQPYFRRQWRLAFNVLCERHAIMLDDACRQCGAPVEFHVGDFGKRLLNFECPIARCGTCGADLRLAVADDHKAPAALLQFQAALDAMLRDGWSPALPGGGSYSFLAFGGLRYMVRLLCSRGRSGRLRALMLAREEDLPLDVPAPRPGPLFEELRIGDRAHILACCVEFLRSWPDEFVRLCREAQVSSTYILRYNVSTPYWLETVIGEHLYDRDYWPTAEEWAAVTAWLTKARLPASANAVRRWLGLSHAQLLHGGQPAQPGRWNRRGPGFR